MIVNVSYEVDAEMIAQHIIDSLGDFLYDLDVSFYNNLSEEEEKKLVTEIAKQMIILAKE